jgi:hypothetical protein
MRQCVSLFFVTLCLSLTTTSLFAKNAEFSETRDLPPLRMAARDLDTVLQKTHLLIAAANGPAVDQHSFRESVTLGIRGHEIEIPHFSLASSVAFPKEVFKFSYTYDQPNRPISSVNLDFSDFSRRVSVSGEAEDQVEKIIKLIEQDLLPYSAIIGGAKCRRVIGMFLSVVFLTSIISSGAYWWNTRHHGALGMLICSILGLLLLRFVPWDRYFAGFALYQSYSPFFLIRHAPEISFLTVVVALAGIPVSYFLSRNER